MKQYFQFILFSIFFICGSSVSFGQKYGNEWIQYDQTYYKFYVSATKLYRIYGEDFPSDLRANISKVQMWHNGEQVAFYVSTSNNSLGNRDYIEFVGYQNDGTMDADLYTNQAYRPNLFKSLETNQSVYYFTLGTDNGVRIDSVLNSANNVRTATPDAYFDYTFKYSPTSLMNPGRANADYGEYLYSPNYDEGEGWTTSQGYNVSFNLSNNLYPYTQGGNAKINARVVGGSYLGTNRTISLALGSSTVPIMTIPCDSFHLRGLEADNIAISEIPTSGYLSLNFTSQNATSNTNDRFAVGQVELTYPRLYNFTGSSTFDFYIDSKNTGNYLSITGFTASGQIILYDLTSGERYTSTTSKSPFLFYINPGSGKHHLFLSSQSTNGMSQNTTVDDFEAKKFIDFKTAGFGNYIIITNKYLRTGTQDAVLAYANYRKSIQGGSYDAKVYDIDQLEDQFAYGIARHPLSIRNFLKYAYANNNNISNVLFMGHGLTYNRGFGNADNGVAVNTSNLVPTFGYPGSDVLLNSTDLLPVSRFPFGRLPVTSSDQILTYLQKIKDYESITKDSSAVGQTVDNKNWLKNIVSIAGGSNASQSSLFISYLNGYDNYLENPYFGGTTYLFNKYTNSEVSAIVNQQLDNLFSDGIGIINYFGHASTTALDYNLSQPGEYNTTLGHYNVFYTSGCDVGDVFQNVTTKTIPEQWIFSENKGSIVFFCPSFLSVTSFLDNYNRKFFNAFSKDRYGQSLGWSQHDAEVNTIQNNFPYANDSIGTTLQAAAHLLIGDPAVVLNVGGKPDYAIEDADVKTNPTTISVSSGSYQLKAFLHNLGKAVDTPVDVEVTKEDSKGNKTVLLDSSYSNIYYEDSLSLNVPIGANDAGQTYLTITIDPKNKISELSESNNTIRKSVFIYSNGVNTIYPYKYSIMRKSDFDYWASTSNANQAMATYVFEIDTTEKFNSPFKQTLTTNSAGGAMSFHPTMSYDNNKVYYWRVAPYDDDASKEVWSVASFMYLTSPTTSGYNQSHYYQHLHSDMDSILLDSISRRWEFGKIPQLATVSYSPFMWSGNNADFSIYIGNKYTSIGYCGNGGYSPHHITFNVYEEKTLHPYYNSIPFKIVDPMNLNNRVPGSENYETCGEQTLDLDPFPRSVVSFDNNSAEARNSAAIFMQSTIPNGAWVVVRYFTSKNPGSINIADWASDDRTVDGRNLFDLLQTSGVNSPSSITNGRVPWVLIYKKGDASFKPVFSINNDWASTPVVNTSASISQLSYKGTLTSPTFGPAKAWHTALWDGDAGHNLNVDWSTHPMQIQVIGVKADNSESVLHTMKYNEKSWPIDVTPSEYPSIKFRLSTLDSTNYDPYQLNYWRILYDAVPEGALVPNVNFQKTADTIDAGKDFAMMIPFKNIGDADFEDSISVYRNVVNASNNTYPYETIRIKPLKVGDTANINLTIPSLTANDAGLYTNYSALVGLNELNVDVNPPAESGYQTEYTHVNNFIYSPLYISKENNSTDLDVTFDGIHIMNNDIVSATPNIFIKLTDESKYLLLKDTSSISISLQYPDGTVRKMYYNGNDTLSFSPAKDSANNYATTNYRPTLFEDGTYQLIVSGKESSSSTDLKTYSVAFQVYTKPMISNVFNYPNPFTTSTAFVFTLTGSQVPQNMRIQILTITGKVVKEITKAELGPLQIGRNITEYKWDGTDQYGNKLANGVYLYRIITNLDGKSLDKFQTYDNDGNAVNTDKYFKAGYGKMYLMR